MNLAQGKGDYLLLIDADDWIEMTSKYSKKKLTKDLYFITQLAGAHGNEFENKIPFIIKITIHLCGKALFMNYKTQKQQKTSTAFFTEGVNRYGGDGSHSTDPEKIQGYITILKNYIANHENCAREKFYLARAYYSARDFAMAIEWDRKYIEVSLDPIEIYCSLLYIAICQKALGYDPSIVFKSFEAAHLYRPSRAEALYEIVRHFTETQNFLVGYL
jgi:hypothetical protein